MKTFIRSTLAIGLALSCVVPAVAAELDRHDPVVASFYRDLDRAPATAGRISRTAREQDRLPEIVRAGLGADPVAASFARDLNREPPTTAGTPRANAETDRLPGAVRAALEGGASSRHETTLARQH